MKEKFVKLSCDNCGENIEFKDTDGYPYSEGWQYIYNINGNISSVNGHRLHNAFNRLDEKDKHFCCLDCLKKFIIKRIEACAIPTLDSNSIDSEGDGEVLFDEDEEKDIKRLCSPRRNRR